MKPARFAKTRKISLIALPACALLALVAWSPTSPDTRVVVGTGNTLNGSTKAMIAGDNNTTNNPSAKLLIVGQENTHYGSNNLLVGNTNIVEGPSTGASAYNSAAIGYMNGVHASRGWAIGWINEVLADQGTAIGVGTRSNVAMGTALGRFNGSMQANDVLVIGAGSSEAETDRFNAIRVTSDGGVFLGRPQGDISMGDYSN